MHILMTQVFQQLDLFQYVLSSGRRLERFQYLFHSDIFLAYLIPRGTSVKGYC